MSRLFGAFKNICGRNESYNFFCKKDVYDNHGNFYDKATYAILSTTFETNLGKKYSKFKATLFVRKGADRKGTDYITVIGDGKILFKSDEMDKTSKPIDIEVDVANINDFKILFINTECLQIANAGFYQ